MANSVDTEGCVLPISTCEISDAETPSACASERRLIPFAVRTSRSLAPRPSVMISHQRGHWSATNVRSF